MNLNPTQIIIIGVVFVFGIPIVAGIIISHFFGSVNGLIAGLVIFLLILVMAQRKLMRTKGGSSDDDPIDKV